MTFPSVSHGWRSLLSTESLDKKDILSLFADALMVEKSFRSNGGFAPLGKNHSRAVALLFFEPSTRTRLSFQLAVCRMGFSPIVMTATDGSTSLEKGETPADAVLNVLAMQPDALIIRYGVSPGLDQLLPTINIPVISAGSGILHHPTQALLDAYTIHREFGEVSGRRVFIFGDIIHSRVARSNFDVLGKLGAEIRIFGPENWLPGTADTQVEKWKISRCDSFKEGLQWADVVMALRVQLERHAVDSQQLSQPDYHRQFGLGLHNVDFLSHKSIIMHPGPINQHVEIDPSVAYGNNSRILRQVENGVVIRAALLQRLFSEST